MAINNHKFKLGSTLDTYSSDLQLPEVVSTKLGKAEVKYFPEITSSFLYYEGIKWMQTPLKHDSSKDLLYSQFDLAYGNVLLTGLGFGILTKFLEQKPEVKTITVIERYQDVVDIYLQNNVLGSNVKIIIDDASEYKSNIKYDCFLPDHYEIQSTDWVLKDMEKTSKNIKSDVFWPWSIEQRFLYSEYPLKEYKEDSEVFIEKYSEEFLDRWKEFLIKNNLTHPFLFKISKNKLITYVEKFSKYHFLDDHN